MNVRCGLACLTLLISCWCCAIPSVSAANHGVRPRRQSRIATLNEYLIPPAPPNSHASRGTGFSRHPRNHQHHGAPQPPQGSPGSGPPPSSFRHGKILTPPPAQTPGYFARLMGWLNPFSGSPTQQPSASQQQRPNNIHQEHFNSGHPKIPPSANGHGPPTNSYEGHVSGETLPRPPPPQGGQPYLPPKKMRNCNPCNQVPWMPLYHGVNTEDARYAANSTVVAIPQSSEFPLNQHQNGDTNIHHVPSFSQEVKIPDFGYGPPLSSPVLDRNHQASSSSAQFNTNNNDNNQHHYSNFNNAQTENRWPLTGPIPNPHLYPGAIPPLFKAVPFGKSQNAGTFLEPPMISADYSQPDTSFIGGEIDGGNLGGGANSGKTSFAPSLNMVAPFPGSQHYRDHVESSSSPFNPPIDHQQSPSQHSVTTLDEGYVDELPPGAEIAPSDINDHFPPPTSFSENHANDNAPANLNNQHTIHSSTNYETQSGTPSITFVAGPKDFQEIGTNSGNSQQSTSYGSQVSSDGQHVIHYEQSPIIDLSTIGDDERRKNVNDSSASSSTSSGTLEEPPVILQNSDGTYGINATWPAVDSSKVSGFQDDHIGTDTTTPTTSALPIQSFSESSTSVRLENFGVSSTVGPASASSLRENRPDTTVHSKQSPRNDSVYQGQLFYDSINENRTNMPNNDYEKTENVERLRQELVEQSGILKTARKQSSALPSLYPGLIRFENSESYGFRLPDPPAGSTSEEPFLQALMKSYGNFKREEALNNGLLLSQPENRESWLDPRQIHPGTGFKPSRDYSQRPHSLGDGRVRSGNRQQGGKKNKQVQIIIPYTSQYTPEPFHPSREDWSTKTSSVQTQARKVPIFDANLDYRAQETRRVEDEVSQILRSLKNSSRSKEVTRSSGGAKTNTSIDVLRLQKNIDNWTIQEYSRGTTASTEIPKFSRPYLSPSKAIPGEYLTTTEPVVPSTRTIEETRKKNGNVLAGFSFNDLEHEGSASDQIDISHVQVSSHINEVSSIFPEILETTTSTSVVTPTIERDTWKQLPVSISTLNKERVYVVTPQSVSTLPTTRRNKSYDKFTTNETTKISNEESDLDHFESIERAYQVLPQAVNNLVVASTGPATIPLWGIMEHDKYATGFNDTTPESPVHYAGHSKVSHTRQ